MDFKSYIGELLKGKMLHFTCDCLTRLNIAGTVVDYYILSGELILRVQRPDGKIYEIGENHPKLKVEI